MQNIFFCLGVVVSFLMSIAFINLFNIYAFATVWRNKCFNPSKNTKYDSIDLNVELEMKIRDLVLVSIMTHYGTVNSRAVAVYNTWAQIIPGKVLFFVGNDRVEEKVSVPVVVLPVEDSVYPPQEKAMLMLKYVWQNYGNQFQWFIRADDDVYINAENLGVLLRSVASSDDVLLGHPGTGLDDEEGKLGLALDSNFCIGGTGIIMSQSVLKKVHSHLDICINNTVTAHEDSEIGRCLKMFAGVQCPWGYEASEYFQQDYGDEKLAYHGDLNLIAMNKAVSFHPIKDPAYLYRLHYHFLSLKLRKRLSRIVTLEKNTEYIKEMVWYNENSAPIPCLHCIRCDEFHPAEGNRDSISIRTWGMFYDKFRYSMNEYGSSQTTSTTKAWDLILSEAKESIIKMEKPQLHHGFYFGQYNVGYMKKNPLKCNVHVVYFTARLKRVVNGTVKSFHHLRRVFIKNSFGKLHARFLAPKDREQVINIVLLCQDCHEHLQSLLRNVQDKLQQENLRIFFVTSRYDTKREMYKNVHKSWKEAEQYKKKAVWIETQEELDSLTVLKTVLKLIHDNELILFTRLDFTINKDFLERCRLNTEKSAPYFPTIIKTPNENNVFDSGNWQYDDYSTFCAFSEDVRSLINETIDEDEIFSSRSLVDRFLSREHLIFRATDPDVITSEKVSCLQEDCEEAVKSSKTLFDYIYEKRYLDSYL